MNNLLLELSDIYKAFPNGFSLKQINLKLNSGQSLGVLGTNGSGKTALVKVISGLEKPDNGYLIFGSYNQLLQKSNSKSKIAVVHEGINLYDHLTVAENICLIKENNKFKIINWNKLFSTAKSICNKYGFSLDVKACVRNLGLAEKRIVSILSAISNDANIIILDEPFEGLSIDDVNKMRKIFAKLKKKVRVLFTSLVI